MPSHIAKEKPFKLPDSDEYMGTAIDDTITKSLDLWDAPLPHELSSIEWPGGDPSPEAEDLRQRCRYDLELFAREFFPDLCTKPFNPMHYDFFADANEEARHPSPRRIVDVAPRESAKSTVRAKIKTVHRGLYGLAKYYLIGSAEYNLARDKTKAIRDIFDMNQKLKEVYGKQNTKDWRMDDFVIAHGCRYRAFTPRSATRGLLWGAFRPTDILLDDAEDRQTVMTPLRRERFAAWFFDDILKLGSQDTTVECIGTILHPESFLAVMLNKPGWKTRRYQSVIQFSQTELSWALWRDWREIVIDLTREDVMGDAWEFFKANEAAMMEGVKVLWPENRSYYQLMLSRVTESESSFWQELQNDPQQDATYLFDANAIGRFSLQNDGLLRDDGRLIRWIDLVSFVQGYDPTPGDNPEDTSRDWAASPVLAQDRWGYQYILDLYTERQDSSDQQLDAVVDLAWKWQPAKLGIEALGFQATLINTLEQKLAQRALQEQHQWSQLLIPIKDVRNKILRIKTLEPRFVNQWLWASDQLPSRFWSEVSGYTTLTKDQPDDCLDAIAMAVHMLSSGEA